MSGTVERFKIRMVGITSKKRDGMSPHKEALGAHQFISLDTRRCVTNLDECAQELVTTTSGRE